MLTFTSMQKYVRTFFDSVLNWSPRKGTRTAAKLPTDFEEKCHEEAFFRLVYVMKWYNVLPKVYFMNLCSRRIA